MVGGLPCFSESPEIQLILITSPTISNTALQDEYMSQSISQSSMQYLSTRFLHFQMKMSVACSCVVAKALLRGC